MKPTKILLLLATLIGCSFALSAQTPAANTNSQKSTTMVLEYFDDDQQLKVYNSEGFEYGSIYLGMELQAGDRVQTKKSTAELRLNPNGSIFKLAPNTNFQIKAFMGANSNTHDFALLTGKLRTVAAKTGAVTGYRFSTPSAVAGVRGTDFGMEVSPGKTDQLVVREGKVDFTQTASGKTISLGAGMGGDALAPTFQPRQFTTQDLAGFFSDLSFSALNPGQVPGQPETQSQTTTTTVAPTKPANDTPGVTPPVGTPPANTGITNPKSSPSAAGPNGGAAGPNPVLEAIKRALGIQIGAIVIQNETYGKLVLQPKIDLPDFKAAFYLPIIYQQNLFDPGNWYKPAGNNEWSFGSDQGSNVLAIVSDALTDLVLKIKYIELFNKGDPFFLDIGNLPSMTLGHGILIGDYANDANFPATRRLGVDMGIDGGNIAWEVLVNDLAKPEIFGTRLLWRPAYPSFKLGTGVSLAADINPLSGLGDTGVNVQQTAAIAVAKQIDPKIFNIAIDLDLPIVEGDIFSMKAYGDFGGLVPYYGNSFQTVDGRTINSGFHFENFVQLNPNPIGLKFTNYGIQAGLMGKALILDYRLEYQLYDGNFQPDYYDQPYDNVRAERALRIVSQAINPATSETGVTKMGIYGKAGANILDIAYISIGYKWPWLPGGPSVNVSLPDFFTSEIRLNKDRMPYGIGFSIGYDRNFFKEIFWTDKRYNFFDENAVFKGIVDIPVGQFFSIRCTVGTSAKQDKFGNIDMTNGQPTMAPTLTIETVF